MEDWTRGRRRVSGESGGRRREKADEERAGRTSKVDGGRSGFLSGARALEKEMGGRKGEEDKGFETQRGAGVRTSVVVCGASESAVVRRERGGRWQESRPCSQRVCQQEPGANVACGRACATLGLRRPGQRLPPFIPASTRDLSRPSQPALLLPLFHHPPSQPLPHSPRVRAA